METRETSYKQIVKSTGIFGGSQLFNMLIGVFRTKVAAALLGPLGVGLIGLYQSIIEMIRSVSGLGLHFSSVRDMAQANAGGDRQQINTTASVLTRWIVFTAILGALLCVVFSKQISTLAFGDSSKSSQICLLSFSVFALTLSAGQKSMLQGMRKIAYMAKASVLGSLSGFIVASILYLTLGQEGIVPALLAAAFLSLVFTWWYRHKLPIQRVSISLRETYLRGKKMVALGLFTMLSGVISTLTMLLLKSQIGRWADLDTVGLFQSSWSLTAIYLSAILSAMSADYYPRLCEVSGDNNKMVRYVNEQLHVVLLAATPLVVGMLLFAPWVLHLFYSAKFVPAEGLLRWQIAGSFLKVLSWPFGYILLSRSKGLLFLLTELLWHGSYLAFTWLLWEPLGLTAAGLAFLLAYVLYTLCLLLLARRICDFRIQSRNLYYLGLFLFFVLSAFLLAHVFHPAHWVKWSLSALLLLVCSYISLQELNRIWPLKDLWAGLKKRISRDD